MSPDTSAPTTQYLRASVSAAAVVLFLLAAWWAVDVLLLAFAGVLLAIIIRTAADFVARHTGLKMGWSLVVVFAGAAAIFTLLILFIAPALSTQIDQLQTDLPAAWSRAQDSLRSRGWGRAVLSSMPNAGEMFSQGRSTWTKLLGAVSTAVSVAADLVVIFFLGLYFAINPGLYRRGLLQLVPKSQEERGRQVLDRLFDQLRHWLLGKLALMLFVGVVTALGLWMLHMPLIITLALLAALLDFIPNIGPIISAVPAVLLALTSSPLEAMWVIVLYLLVQIVESYILQPLVQQRAVSLAPSVTLAAQIVVATLLGPLGLVLATPLTVVAITLIQMLYITDYLGKSTET